MPRPSRYVEREGGEADPARDAHRTTLAGDHRDPGDEADARRGPVQEAPPAADPGARERRGGTVRFDEPADAPRDTQRQALDERGEQRQSSDAPQPSEAEREAARSVARRMGWTPKEEWTRDPTKWVDEFQFLDRTPQEVERLRERAKRSGAVADNLVTEARQRGADAAREDLRSAVEAQDTEAATRAAERLAQAAQPDPRSVAWAARNPWFESDPAASAVAQAAALKSKQAGGSFDDQLDAAEAEVRRRFPEHFGGEESRRESRDDPPPRDERGEVRLSEVVRPRPPAMEGGNRNGGGRPATPKAKGWGDIPPGVRDQMARQVRQFESAGVKREDAQARISRTYWREQGE